MDAVHAVIEAQHALHAHTWPEGVSVRVRMGIHTGEPQISASEHYVGIDIHRAARIAAAAHGGQVLISETTCDLVERELPEDVTLRDLGEHRLKDLRQPKHLYQLVIAGLPSGFPPLKSLDAAPNNLPIQLTSFIGRSNEMERSSSYFQMDALSLTGLARQDAAGIAGCLRCSIVFIASFRGSGTISDPGLMMRPLANAEYPETAGHPSSIASRII
jgi:hypothetical protein